VGDTSVRAIHTPGHAPDHLCFWHEETRSAFCGDLAQKGTTIFIPAGRGGDVGEYIESLERILGLEPARLFPAHGPIIDDPASLIRHYIRHRQERETQILDALRLGDTSAEAMVTRLYRSVPPNLFSRACDTVTAHLLKLEREGRVHREDDAWHIITGRST
jgi:glyoxylase-like metal-dependent hydrolase (beta-lactamase superfamily II)